MNPRFNNKICIVTGAAQGIGQGVALALAAEGGTVVLADRSEFVHHTAEAIRSAGGKCLTVMADLETFAGAQSVVDAAVAEFGRVDVAVHNVGGTIWAKPYQEYAEAEIAAEVRRSLFPTLWGCRAVLPYMLKKKKGAIVNVSSIATRSVNRVPYGAAKGGVNALTACLAFENGERGIRVNAVAPGGTEAPARRIPRNTAKQSKKEQVWYQEIVDQTVSSTLMKRYGTLDEQAAAILFLASDEASYITGTVLPVGGGDQG